jgi:hypothetical protein
MITEGVEIFLFFFTVLYRKSLSPIYVKPIIKSLTSSSGISTSSFASQESITVGFLKMSFTTTQIWHLFKKSWKFQENTLLEKNSNLICRKFFILIFSNSHVLWRYNIKMRNKLFISLSKIRFKKSILHRIDTSLLALITWTLSEIWEKNVLHCAIFGENLAPIEKQKFEL